MDTLGKRLYPGLATAAANAAVQSAIQTSTNYMLGISASAMDTVRQTAMSNMMIDAQYLLPAQIGDAASASANLAQAQAIRSTSDSYKMMAKLAESTMPKVKNIVEIVQYSVFPIILLLILMAGHKGGLVIKAYVMSLVWVQLWPPLYAVMHLVITMHSQELATMTGGMGLSMSQYSLVNNAYISDAAIAGMISATAIPAIAAAIVKGVDVGAQAIAGMSAPARESERIASGMSAGNMQMGNSSLGNQSADNLSMGQYNARPTITQGGFSATGADNVGHFHGMEGGMATHLVNNTGAFQNIGAKVGLSGKAAGAFQKAAENFDRAAILETVAAHESLSSAFSQSASFDKGHGRSTSGSSQDMTSAQAQFTRAYQEAQKIAHQYAQQHGLNQRQEAELMASAGVQASGGLNFMGNGATVTGDAGLKGKSVAGTSQVQTAAQQFAKDKGFTSAISSMRTAAHQESFTRGDEVTKRAALGIRSSFDQVLSHEKAASAALEKTQIYKEAATSTREMAGSYDTNHINQFVDWMGQQRNPITGNNFTVVDVEQMARLSPDYMNDYAQKFTDEHLVPAIDQHTPAPTNNMATQFVTNKAAVPGADTITPVHQQNDAVVMSAANRSGVNPNTGPANNVSGQVKAMTGQAKGDIRSGKVGVIGEGAPIQGKAERATDPTGQHNIALATQNATAEIMPEGTMKLLDKAGLIDPNSGVAMPAADSFKGSTTEAVVDTAIAVGGMAVGGFGGRIAGEGSKWAAKKAGDTAMASATKAAANVEERLAANAAAPGASQVAKDAVSAAAEAGREGNAIRGSASAGAERETTVAATLKVGGTIAGATGGGSLGGWGAKKFKDEIKKVAQPIGNAVSNANDAILDGVKGAATDAKNLGNQIVEKGERK